MTIGRRPITEGENHSDAMRRVSQLLFYRSIILCTHYCNNTYNISVYHITKKKKKKQNKTKNFIFYDT